MLRCRKGLLGMICGIAIAPLASAVTMRASAGTPAGFRISHSDDEWRRLLTPTQYAILRQADTEEAESSPLDEEFGPGRYDCSGCDQGVFGSAAKFDSKTGWPSFWQALRAAVVTTPDNSFGVTRVAVLCAACGGHLGHVFDDGPKPTGLRYCTNGAVLSFRPSSGH